ncbi:hypothetical protein RUM43_006264 [Polyplax serrata]|uniref:Uncharacterized protein n=1 Tax=Polyplax serrata TaxID=468196 RepID=A0AAN8PKY3_POLSC
MDKRNGVFIMEEKERLSSPTRLNKSEFGRLISFLGRTRHSASNLRSKFSCGVPWVTSPGAVMGGPQTIRCTALKSTISPEAKEVYSSLVEQPAMEAQIILPPSSLQSSLTRGGHNSSCFRQPAPAVTVPSCLGQFDVPDASESSPLRMLRTGAFPMVRPKGKVSRVEKPVKVPSAATLQVNSSSNHTEEESSQMNDEERWRKDSTSSATSLRKDSTSSHSQLGEEDNPIPLPPRDRSKPSVSNKPRHQRKHPLIIPQGCDMTADKHDDVFHPPSGTVTTPTSVTPTLPPQHPLHNHTTVKPHEVDDSFDQQIATELDALDNINTETDAVEEAPVRQDSPRDPTSYNHNGYANNEHHHVDLAEHFLSRRLKRRDEDFCQVNGSVKTKPNLRLKQKIAQLNQTASMYTTDGTDDGFFGSHLTGACTTTEPERNHREPEETMRRHEDHVSCEDLLEFSAKSKSKSRGQDSDEVRLMSKVLGKEMTSENCLKALNATDWDVYSAIKLAKLQNILKNSGVFQNISSCWDALVACDGDVVRAASVLITQGSPPDCV